MNTHSLIRGLLTACSLTVLATLGRAENDPVTKPAPSAEVPIPADPAPAPTEKLTPWSALQNLPFEQRELLISGLKPLIAKVSGQITDLQAKREVMVAKKMNTGDWDFAMKEMNNAFAYLSGMAEDLGNAQADSWDHHKQLFGLAWVRTQAAFAKVKASTTN